VDADLGDKRLEDRLEQLIEGFSEAPTRAIPQVFEERKDVKAAYRFFDNERITHEALVEWQREDTAQRLSEREERAILFMQDTTSFDYSHHPAVEDMGPLENEHMNGFLAHSTIAVSEDGVPLGLWEQQVWTRDRDEWGKSQQRHERVFEDKESYKWVEGLPEGNGPWITVCDREAHVYDFLVEVDTREGDFIVRASKGRGYTTTEEPLFEVVAQWPAQKQYTISLPRRPDRDPREATVEIRFGRITLARPYRSQADTEALSMCVVDVCEIDPPAGETGVHWVLLTSLPVKTVERARQIVRWYAARWLVERFHYVLKSGCRIEERQLQTRARLQRLLGVFNLVAWRLLWLTYQSRQTPDASCEIVLSDDEWQALYARIHKTTDLPATPPTLYAVTRWIAKLGGFLGRKGDGDPGVKVLWRGWIRLQDFVAAWRLFHPSQIDMGNA
jgi:hypothetical protein